MDKIREKVVAFMEHNPVLTELEDKNWYSVEDGIAKLICNLLCVDDKTYEDGVLSNCDKAEYDDCPTTFEETIYKKVDRYYHRQDILNTIDSDQEERNWEGVPRLVYTLNDVETMTNIYENRITGEENCQLAREVLLDYQDEHTFDETV